MDNILLTHELLHSIQRKRSEKLEKMVVKLDMSKVYDKIEWKYLQAFLIRLGFHDQWVSLVMPCLTSITYSVLINGKSGTTIVPTQGLR